MKTNTKNNNNNNNNKNNNNNNNKTNNSADPKGSKVVKVVFDNRIKRKNVLALNEKVAAIREYEKRPIYKRIGRMFHCSPDQIKRIVQQKESILHAWEQRTRRCKDAKTLEMKVVRVSMLGKAVYEWIRRMMYYKDIVITDGLIQKMALQFKSAMGLQNFFPHQEWCDKFRQIYNIHESDSKLLSIGYTQGHSVQIKDVMKDVLSECTPEGNGSDGDDCDELDDRENDQDDGDISVGSAPESKSTKRPKTQRWRTPTPTQQHNHPSREGTANVPLSQLQGLRQLVALPIQANGVPGMTQKVLVATPITPAGQRPGATPMTMTIIPLATLTQQQKPAPAPAPAPAEKQVTVPPPMVEIKREIKEEPKDEEDEGVEEVVQIKKECISDDEEEAATEAGPHQTAQSPPPLTARVPMPHLVSIPMGVHKDNVDETTTDSADDDNLALSSLRELIQNQNHQNQNQNCTKASEVAIPDSAAEAPAENCAPRIAVKSPQIMPPLPPLIKAPTAVAHVPVNRTAPKRHRPNEDTLALPPIQSCSEARKYLKLLEDFALVRENFRLIGLITRADEVLRELDRQEHNDDDDDDDDDDNDDDNDVDVD